MKPSKISMFLKCYLERHFFIAEHGVTLKNQAGDPGGFSSKLFLQIHIII